MAADRADVCRRHIPGATPDELRRRPLDATEIAFQGSPACRHMKRIQLDWHRRKCVASEAERRSQASVVATIAAKAMVRHQCVGESQSESPADSAVRL